LKRYRHRSDHFPASSFRATLLQLLTQVEIAGALVFKTHRMRHT
jgi:hypothetical protein